MIRPALADKSPSLTFDSGGRLWLARVAMEESSDVIAVRSRTGQDWSGDFAVARGTVGAPRLVTQGSSVWVFWHERRAGNWDIFARQFEGSRWRPELRVTTAPGAELHPVVAREGRRVWVAYESIDSAGFAIGVRVLEESRWSPPARLAVDIPQSIERRPTIAGASGGGIWLAWDSTRTGNPDIFLALRVEIVKDLVDTFAAVRLEQNPSGPDGVFMVYDPGAPQGGTLLRLDDTSRLRFSARDAGAAGREHVYYVRATQANGQQAWSSPIWVRFK